MCVGKVAATGLTGARQTHEWVAPCQHLLGRDLDQPTLATDDTFELSVAANRALVTEAQLLQDPHQVTNSQRRHFEIALSRS